MTIRKFSIPCSFNGVNVNVDIYVGNPDPKHNPIQFQAKWLAEERGGTVPADIMESFAKIHEIAKRNNVPFADLCQYAVSIGHNSSTVDQVADLDKSMKEKSSK